MALYNRVNGKVLKERLSISPENRTTISFYKYHHIANPKDFRDELYNGLQTLNVLGRIYVSGEGINAQISVRDSQCEDLRNFIFSISFLKGVRLNHAIQDNGKSFLN